MPCRARLLVRVLVAGEGRLDAGLDAVQAMLASLGRSGALIISAADSRQPDRSARPVIAWRFA
jgi:hypothetical protein